MSYQEQFDHWLASPALSPDEKNELLAIKDDEKEKESRFFSQLSFGTAGLRGTMGVGLYRMNLHVIRHATHSFAQVILKQPPAEVKKGVAICYDCRNNSDIFAREAACIMVANGISVRLFDAMRPTPELSFAIREYGCLAGINITASHNPKEYNGYKVYWSDGAQLPPLPASQVAETMQALDVFACPTPYEYDKAVAEGKITIMGETTDEAFLAKCLAEVIDKNAMPAVADNFKMVYTPFHGTGHYLIPEALKRAGMKHVICVPEQMVLDGNFPTVVSPNPENAEGFALAVELAKKNGAQFILASDPDADRVGIMVAEADGSFKVISGNQTGVLLLDYIITARNSTNSMPKNPTMLKTIVTTEMARKVAEVNNVACHDTFTGFKFLAEKKDKLESANEGTVIFSYEESFGYMLGDFVRDKDAVTASLLLSEMAAHYAAKNMTLSQAIQSLFEKYGYYNERTINIEMQGVDGLKNMATMMQTLRQNPPTSIEGTSVVERRDYQDGSVVDTKTGATTSMELSGSNVLRYTLEDGTVILVRPSGTEPKVKLYLLTSGSSSQDCDNKIEKYSNWKNSLVK
ncbi:MAG: phospho-sugar mutase [Eubacteriales bacterium]